MAQGVFQLYSILKMLAIPKFEYAILFCEKQILQFFFLYYFRIMSFFS